MRVDKFLWCIRLFKTRALATAELRLDKVSIDEQPVKASREVKLGDTIEVKRHGYTQHFEVLNIPKGRLGAKLVPEYVKEITPDAELEKREFLLLAKNFTRRKGLGRPTKKDRRDLEDYSN
ncbi:MAG: RNA-binding S4 domain-containing protein [Schleiferiaceae bacterium]|nr:RNA-binding S4 domain-containing protein [Schleiferiaceae bacterium]